MILSELIKAINNLSDEQEPPDVVVGFINDAIAKINVECDSNFPYLDINQSNDEPKFPDKWQRVLLIPFGVGRIKQRDSSQFEYSDAYNEFFMNLSDFKSKYLIPDEFRDANSNTSYASDIYITRPYPDWRF